MISSLVKSGKKVPLVYTYVFQEAHGVTEIREYSRAHAVLGEQNMMQATELITQSPRERERERVRPSIGMDVAMLFSAPVLVGLLVLLCLAYIYYRSASRFVSIGLSKVFLAIPIDPTTSSINPPRSDLWFT